MDQHDTFEFSLQLFERDDAGSLLLATEVRRAVAQTPECAAEKLLHEHLRPMGERTSVRAKAWRIGPDGKPIVTMLYR